jgi:hypothetical protein
MPPNAAISIAGRRGVDLAPIDPVADGDRLIAYVWPDQQQRLNQLETALALAAADPPPAVDRGDAADWLDTVLAPAGTTGELRVVLHSVAYQYFPATAQARVRAQLERIGAAATPDAPLAWLRFEQLPDDDAPSLRLATWPGEDRLLGWAQPHGARMTWTY